MELNKYQTQITDELLESLHPEIKDDLLDVINNVEFVRRLISSDRLYARNLPRDDLGRIIVDVCNPHILEDMDYFRPTALHYKNHGTITNLRPNSNPNTEYGKWIRLEIDRCWNGMVRESDGEWITGDMYFYLNYCPIIQSKVRKGTKIADRIVDFPEVWEGIYWRFHYIHQARYGGKYNNYTGGQHCAEIAARGRSKSYSLASMLTKVFILGENKDSQKQVRAMVTAYQKEYLTKDGTLTKFIEMADFCASNTQFPSKRLKASIQEMTWKMGFTDVDSGVNKGTLNEVIGVSSRDDVDKLRGKRSSRIFIEEFGNFPKIIDIYRVILPSVQEGDISFGQIFLVGCVCAGTKVYKADGELIDIKELKQVDGILGYNGVSGSKESVTYLQPEVYKECLRIETSKNNFLECSIDHPLLVRSNILNDRKKTTVVTFKKAEDLKIGDRILMANNVSNFGNKQLDKAELVGLLIGDGNYSVENSVITLSVSNNSLYNYLDKNYKFKISKVAKSNDGVYAQIYFDCTLKKYLKEINIFGQKGNSKRLPCNIHEYDESSVCALLRGYFEADGNIQIFRKSRVIKLTSISKELLEDVKYQLLKLGINSAIRKESKGGGILKSKVNNREYNMKKYGCYVLYITDSYYIDIFKQKIGFISTEKQVRLDSFNSSSLYRQANIYKNGCKFKLSENNKGKYFTKLDRLHNIEGVLIKNIKNIGTQRVYNLTANDTHTYITNGFVSGNTGGSEGADFAGAQEILYNPRGYNIYALPNYFDKNSQGKSESIFFFGAYVNRKECYNENGVSDVIKALLELFHNRFNVKYNSSDTMALTRTKAENPVTIQEAIMKRDSSLYPVSDLIDRINDLQVNPKSLDDIYVGKLSLNFDGVSYLPSNDEKPIREFPHKDNKMIGSIEIHKMPEKDSSGKVFSNRYISGCLTPGEKVNTLKGLKNVEDVTLEDKLINIFGEPVKIKNLQQYDVIDENIYTVKLSNIYNSTTFTKEHPIYTCTPVRKYNGIEKVKKGYPERYYTYDFNFKKVDELKIGDYVKTPNIYKCIKSFKNRWNDISRTDRKNNSPLEDKDFWWLIGLILGDGWTSSNGYSINISFNSKEVEYINKAKSIVNRLFNRKFTLAKDTGTCKEYIFSYKYLNMFISENFGRGAKNKNLPEWTKYLPEELKKNLFLGYLASDGSVVSGKDINFTSISLKLLNDFQDVLFSLGIISAVSLLRKAKQSCINGVSTYQQETYKLLVSKERVLDIINWGYKDLKLATYNIRKFANHNIKRVFFSKDLNYIFLRVNKIEKESYTGVVYNYECDTHTFMCNYIPTHNCDPFDDDVSETMSLGSIYILDLWTDEIVFEYTGRPQFADDFYELCRRALMFYNANCNYENNKKGLFKYFSQTNSLYLLSDTLDFLKDKDMVKGYFTLSNKTKGTLSTAPVKSYARRCVRDWLLKPVLVVEESDGVQIEVTKPLLTTIKSIALLKELSQWNSDGNFDRHDALGMLMLIREDRLRLLGDRNPESIYETDANYVGNDNYFINNYDNKFKKKEF